MGNKQSEKFEWENYYNILQRNFNDNTLIVQKKGSSQQFLARQMMSSDKKQSHEIKRLIHYKTHSHNPFITKLIQFYYNNDAAYCSPQDKIYLVFEKPKQTLRQQILARKFANEIFSEEEADVILQSGAKAIKSLKQAQQPHNNISTSSIFIDEDRRILLGDPWITPPVYTQDINQNVFACPSPQKILFQNDQILTMCPYRSDLFSLGTVVLEALNFEHMDVLYEKGFRKLVKSRVQERLSKIKDDRLRYKLSVVLSHDPQNREQIYNMYRNGAEMKNKAIHRQNYQPIQEEKTNNSTLNFKKKLTRINSSAQVVKQAQVINKPMPYQKVGANFNQPYQHYNPGLSTAFKSNPNSQNNFLQNLPPNQPSQTYQPTPYFRPHNLQNYSQAMNITNSNFQYGNFPNHNRYGNFSSNNAPIANEMKTQTVNEVNKTNSKYQTVYKPDMTRKTVSGMNSNTNYASNLNNNLGNFPTNDLNYKNIVLSNPNEKAQNRNPPSNSSNISTPINLIPLSSNQLSSNSLNNSSLNLVNVSNQSNRKSDNVDSKRYSQGLQNKLYKTQKVSTEVTENNFQPVLIKSGNDFVNLSANIRFVESSSLEKSKSGENHDQNQSIQHIGNYGVKNISEFVAVKTPVQSFELNPKQQIYESNINRKSVSDSSDKVFLDAITEKPNQIINYMTQSKETPQRRPTRKYNSTIKQQPDENSYSGSRDGDDDYQYVVEEYDAGRYQGQRKNGMRNGYGKFYYIQGSVYEGQWKDNTMHGKGNLYYSNGRLAYEGDWRMDEFHGYGKVYNEDQVPIQGSFDYRDFTDVNDFWASYEGQLNADRRHGRGKIKFSNGQIFSGNFALDIVQGEGKFYKLNGQIIHGIWSKNKLVKKI